MRLLFTLITGILMYTTSHATVFTVTSNANSGPGTLREAIEMAAANGTSSTDYIHFNIPDNSIAGRTITVSAMYPDLSSNIVIDGTTQPGSFIGVSNAKIRITNSSVLGFTYIFRFVAGVNLEIYGLHFNQLNSTVLSGGHAVDLFNCTGVKIGDAGKGNYFTNLSLAVARAELGFANEGFVTNLSFKGNILNLTEDGNDWLQGSNAAAISFTNVRNLDFGGELPGEGNYIVTPRDDIMGIATDTLAHLNLGYIKIIGNKLGCNYSQTAQLFCGTITIQNYESYGYSDTTHITVKDNSFDCKFYAFSNSMRPFIVIRGKKGYVEVKNNRIGMLANPGSYYSSIVTTGISISRCENGIIGGDGPNDKNYIAGCNSSGIGLGDNKNITISKNSLFCNTTGIFAFSNLVTIPVTEIDVLNDYFVQGTTSVPNCTVEVFITRKCGGCKNGEIYLGSTTSDASGNWSFTSTVLLDAPVTANATTPQGASGAFASPEYKEYPLIYQSPVCGMNNGYIHGMQMISGTGFYWVKNWNGQSDTLYTQDIDNLGPGSYTFVVEQGKYCKVTYSIFLNDNSPLINDQNPGIVHPSCGLNNGAINGVWATGSYQEIIWQDTNGNTVSNQLQATGLPPGQYRLIVKNTTYQCADTSVYINLVNQSGPSLNLTINISPSTCGNNNGSISGISAVNVTGSAYVIWVNEANTVVSNQMNAVNLLPGNYRIKFKDQGTCDTIIAGPFNVPSAGVITMDSSGVQVTAADCGAANGGLANIVVTGADTYQWVNAAGQVMGTSLHLNGVPAGAYVLVASNSLGCQLRSDTVRIPSRPFINANDLQAVIQPGTCNSQNGQVTINNFPSPGSYSFQWLNVAGNTIAGNSLQLTGINSGTFDLYVENSFGCRQKVYTVTVPYIAPVALDSDDANVTNSTCSKANGAISGMGIIPGTGMPGFNWSWQQNGNNIANTQDLQHVSTGNYRVIVTDANGCRDTSLLITIGNTDLPSVQPIYQDQTIRSGTTAQLQVQNPQQGTYLLFDNAAMVSPLMQNGNGNFTTPVLNSDKEYFIQFRDGTCESPGIRVLVKVFDKTEIYVPSVFTPNNDSKNDLIKPVIYGPVDLEYFTVYNRYGYAVYTTSATNNGWDGYYKGELQPSGGYVWILKCRDRLNGAIISKRGSFVLIR